jgi:hypothetical protein
MHQLIIDLYRAKNILELFSLRSKQDMVPNFICGVKNDFVFFVVISY